MGSQDHIAVAIDNDATGISRNIFKQLRYYLISMFGNGGLLGTNLAKCYMELVVYGMCREQESVNNFSDALDEVVFQWRAVIQIIGILRFSTIVNFNVTMGQ